MTKRQPVRGQAVKWCVCGDWFASQRDEREHAGRCPGPTRSVADRRELRNFRRFLRLWPRFHQRMLVRPVWLRYLNINECEAHHVALHEAKRRGALV